jgi:hypothetical protein
MLNYFKFKLINYKINIITPNSVPPINKISYLIEKYDVKILK